MNEQWESPDNKPENGAVVLFMAELSGPPVPILGRYLHEREEVYGGENFDFGEYDDATDEYYFAEGWYERNLCSSDDGLWKVLEKVVAWMPLPRYEP